MNAIKLLAETPETVTISRSDLDALIDAAENAEDIASVRAWNAYVATAGQRQQTTVGSASNQSAWMTTAGRGLTLSPCKATTTMSPRRVSRGLPRRQH